MLKFTYSNVKNSRYSNDILPTNPKHPFWKSGIRSAMTLSRINSRAIIMRLSVHMLNVYKIEFICSHSDYNSVLYHHKKEAIIMIRDGWMKYYEHDTQISCTYINFSGDTISDQIYTLSPRCIRLKSPRRIKRSNSLG